MTNGRKYFILLLLAVIINYTAGAQSQFKIWGGNLGAPIYNQNFGFGGENDSVAGPPLPAGVSGFSYSNSICPPPGSYSIVQKVNPKNCYGGKWLLVSLDHKQEDFGNMMLVHNIASSSERIVYVDTVNHDLCANTVYEFSAAIINVDALDSCVPRPDYPSFRFSLEDASGTVLKSYITPEISASPRGTSAGPLWKFSIYGLDYTIPVGMNKVVLKIILLRSNVYNNCNNDFAIDDILFSPAGPTAKIAFTDDAYDGYELVKGVCFQANESISFKGMIVPPGFNNPAVQWQQSTDNGITWTDIPGATNYTFTKTFSVPDTFLIRMRASEANKIGNPNCSVVSDTRKVEVDGLPPIDSISNNSPVCSGSDLQFNASGGASYIWTGPNGFYDNVSYAHIYHATLADSGTYYVQIKSFGGCVATASTHVTILGTADVTAGLPQSICKSNSAQLAATGGDSYIWKPATGLSDPKIANPKATPQVTTIYTVIVTNNFGCTDSASVKITLLNTVAVKAIMASPGFLCRPSDSATFKDMSLGNIANWNWDFGNGVKSTLQNPPVQNYFIESNATDYTVKLIVSDSAGCADTTSHVLKVENNCYIAVPNAFTPNGDGLNDYLYPLNAYKATNLTFRVFNRYGQLVFETTDWTKKWDGTKDGDPMPAGVYVWMLGYTDQSNKKVFLKGYTVLLR